MGIDAIMIARVPERLTPRQVTRMAYELVECFGTDPFVISRGTESWSSGRRYHALEIVRQDYHRAEGIPKNDTQTLLEVNLAGRYYGDGYERGNLPILVTIARWLERKIPRTDVFYGGDNRDRLELFDGRARKVLFNHFIEHGHRPYRAGFSDADNDSVKPPHKCTLCLEPYVRFGYGPKFGAFSCHGCGHKLETKDNGDTYYEKKED